MQLPFLCRHYPTSPVLWSCPTACISSDFLRFTVVPSYFLLKKMQALPSWLDSHYVKRDWLFDPAEAHQFSPYRPVCFTFHSDYSVSPPNNKISRLHHLVTPLPRCLRFTASITVYSTRLANGGWLNLSVQASHLLDYPPFVWAHNSDLSFYDYIISAWFCLSVK